MTERKTIQSADVMKALGEIEMAQVMNLGVMGKDGKRGGRVEREVEAWEGNVRGKRRGYRDKVKARDSVGGVDTTVGSVDVDVDGDEHAEREDGVHESKRRKRDSQDELLQAEADGDVSMVSETTRDNNNTNGANQTKASHNRANDDEEDAEDIDDSADDNEDEQQDEEDEENPEETQDAEDPADVEETSRRKNAGTLAPDGRIEVAGSDDDESD